MKIGFIGLGNMAYAMMSGIIDRDIVEADDVIGYDPSEAGRQKAYDSLEINIAKDNKGVINSADIVVLSVKPQVYPIVIKEIKDLVREDQIIVSIAPGKTIAWLTEQFSKEVKLVRCMPNTPALVGEGCTGVCRNKLITDEEFKTVLGILSGFSKAIVVNENQMDAVVAVSGSSPAYVFMMIEAMADAAVAEGLTRKQAYEFAAQAVYGSAKMVLQTGLHPGELKDMVCSPAGTTIDAVKVLEETGFRASIMDAMEACADKSRRM